MSDATGTSAEIRTEPGRPTSGESQSLSEKKEGTNAETVSENPQHSTESEAIRASGKNEVASEQRRGILDFLRYREIKEDDLNQVLDQLREELLESDVVYDVTERIVEGVKNTLVGKRIRRGTDVKAVVVEEFRAQFYDILRMASYEQDLITQIKHSGKRPYIIMFYGVNGVGKTTTIAKFAYLLRRENLRPIIAATDTFRAAAQEQLQYHAEKLEVPLVKGKYGGDPASVSFDAVNSAKARGLDVVLIDTAGRMHNDKNLVEELKRMVRIIKPDQKILVIDSLAGSDAMEQARRFNDAIQFTGIILTKVDADIKGGIALSLAYELKKPIYYLGVGQSYEDLINFTPEWIIRKIFGE